MITLVVIVYPNFTKSPSTGSSSSWELRIFIRADSKGGSDALSTVRHRMDQVIIRYVIIRYVMLHLVSFFDWTITAIYNVLTTQ
jgi:hypothetical protein